jgi:hypothetical protein
MSADVSIPHSPDAVRRTALVLHALAPADREWVLGRLPERNRAQVMPCLEELAALGIPRDADLVNIAPTAKEPVPVVRARRSADVERLVAVLEDEPANLIATTLRSRAEADRAAVLDALAPARAQEVRELLDTPATIPQALRAALDEAICGHDTSRRRISVVPRGTLARRWQAGWLRIAGVFQ